MEWGREFKMKYMNFQYPMQIVLLPPYLGQSLFSVLP